jgi:hypothetical protein
MALTETTKVDQVEVLDNNIIQVRTATIIEKDGIEISRTFNRHVLEPGADIENEDLKVKSIANAIWTNEIIEKYQLGLNDSVSKTIE